MEFWFFILVLYNDRIKPVSLDNNYSFKNKTFFLTHENCRHYYDIIFNCIDSM